MHISTLHNRQPSCGGLVLGWDKKKKNIFYSGDDTHTLSIGTTRSGKTRHLVLPSIGLTALSGESMVISDPKSELYLYTAPFLERLGYEVIALDFIHPELSRQYNFLQPVLDAVYLGDIPRAVHTARSIANLLVPDSESSKTDPLWPNGEKAILTVAILAVCLESPDLICKNLDNSRHFLAKMCVPGADGKVPLIRYLDQLPIDSPLRAAMAVAQIAPDKMRGSFYSSALTTLNLFQDPHIHTMTSVTDFDHLTTGDRKRAIFIIFPDSESTYYPLVSLFVFQQYQLLVRRADENGGRLPHRVHFILDEFGNFAKIPDMDKAITVGGGRGIRFHLVVQDTNQIYERYGERLGKTMTANCETWIYLQTDNSDTVKEIVEDRLGSYTIKSPNLSASSGGSSSASYSFTGRKLLTIEELRRIRRPWQLVLSRGDPAILYAPDISQTFFNTMFGMGNKSHNQRLCKYRSGHRTARSANVSYWNIKFK